MNEAKPYPYATCLDVKFPALSVVDVPALVAACKDRWYNQTLCQVNDSVVRLGVLEGDYHWHKHDRAVILMVETAAIVPTGDA
jgi:hypothetical protein